MKLQYYADRKGSILNILIVSQCFYPDNFRINDIAQSLVSMGHQVRVLTGLPDYATSKVPKEYRWFRRRRESINGVQVVRVPIIARHKGVLFRALNYASFVVSSWLYASFCKKKDIDVIFCYQTSPVLQAYAARRLKHRTKKPLVLYCCDLWPESLKAFHVGESHPLFHVVKRISRKLYRACDKIAVTSAPFHTYLTDLCGDDVNDRIFDLPQHAEDLYADICGVYEENECVDFLFAGNIGAVQNVDCIIKAIPHIQTDKPFMVHIVGDGSELSACKELSESLHVTDHITFHGRFPLAEMERFYKLADCFLLTLRGGDFIGMTLPAKAQGYLSAGKPIAGAIDGAAAQMIEESDCGECVRAGDAEGLGAVMQKIIENPKQYRKKGENGRVYYEQHYTKEIFMNTFIKLLEE